MNKSKRFLPILIPSLTVFFSSACILIIELVASRLIAKYLGSSLYTWTAVIGIVLSGITIGNYIGGRIADRFNARKALSVLFGLASFACVLIVILNNLVGEWIWLWHFSLPVRVFTHIFLVFMLPSTLLGTISPVVAKMALDQGLATGRTVGDIYAWGAAGSIAGTFLAGYYLIAAMGTIAIIWTIGTALLILAIIYWAKLWVLYIWAVIFFALMTMGMIPTEWAVNSGSTLALRKPTDANILYENESQYCYIAVKQLSQQPDKRAFIQDRFTHSKMIKGNLSEFLHYYMHNYAAVTNYLSKNKRKITTLTIGGGGYVYPRYIKKMWPESRVDVVEIDPGVTKAAKAAYGLPKDTSINTYNMDARNYVDKLLQEKKLGKNIPKYDFIYEDAINHYTVPYQLVTKEFNQKITQILADDGVYMVNLMDIYTHSKLLGSFISTLNESFPYVYVMTKHAPKTRRSVFIVTASRKKLHMQTILKEYRLEKDIWLLNKEEIAKVKERANHLVLTDNYVPVEHMLTPMIRQSAMEFLTGKYLREAKELKKQAEYSLAINKYQQLIENDHTMSVLAYNEIATLQAKLGKVQKAITALEKAIEYNQQAEYKISSARLFLNMAFLTRKTGKKQQAESYFKKAISAFKNELVDKPDSLSTNLILAKTLDEIGANEQASKYYKKVVDLDPYKVENHNMLAQSFVKQDKYVEALNVLKKARGFMQHIGDKQKTSQIQKYMDFVAYLAQKNKDTSDSL